MEGQPEQTADSLTIKARDEDAQLGLETRLEAMAGGSLRIRYTLRNLGADPFLLEGLKVRLPLDDQQTQILDFAGRHDVKRSLYPVPVLALDQAHALRWPLLGRSLGARLRPHGFQTMRANRFMPWYFLAVGQEQTNGYGWSPEPTPSVLAGPPPA